jgi:hypothetical protein
MQTKYKHIDFAQAKSNGQDVWVCNNTKHDEVLGLIEYYEPWKQYVFSATDNTMIFSVSCLQDIIHFIGQLK